jgi:hypothetical protein
LDEFWDGRRTVLGERWADTDFTLSREGAEGCGFCHPEAQQKDLFVVIPRKQILRFAQDDKNPFSG